MSYAHYPSIQQNASKGLIKTLLNGVEVFVPDSGFVASNLGFAGTFDLSTPHGTFWNDFTQTAAIVVGVNGNSRTGGCDRIKITMGGFAFTLPADWTNVGVDAIDTTNLKVNIIYAVKTPSGVDYSVKLI